jgi:hypothetical protein
MESLALGRELGEKRGIASSLAGLGGMDVRGAGVEVGVRQEVQVERGVRLLGAVEGLLQSMDAVLDREYRESYERSVLQARTQLREAAFEKAWQEGRAMSMEQAIAYALEFEEATAPVSDEQT